MKVVLLWIFGFLFGWTLADTHIPFLDWHFWGLVIPYLYFTISESKSNV